MYVILPKRRNARLGDGPVFTEDYASQNLAACGGDLACLQEMLSQRTVQTIDAPLSNVIPPDPVQTMVQVKNLSTLSLALSGGAFVILLASAKG